MRSYMLPLLLATVVSAQPGPALPTLVKLNQDAPRSHANLKLPPNHKIGPTIPGLKHQGAIPQGLAFWEHKSHKWLLISCYFDDGRPSVVVALEAQKPHKMVRCLTLVEASGQAHAGHVGGLAVSHKYLWIGSGLLYRVPLADVLAAKLFDHLRLQTPFKAECNASYVGYHDKRVWVGEFVDSKDPKHKGNPEHFMKARDGTNKHAWIAGYALDADENLKGAAGGNHPLPAVLSVGEHVQGMAFLGGRIILSTSSGRTTNSTLAAYTDPLRKKHHTTKKVGDKTFQVWFLDKKNHKWDIHFPPMSEGITAHGKGLAAICESGAEKYQTGGHGPLDSVIFFPPPAGK
jgi:hypothetical protein